jgi:hypothetical protein
VTQQKKAALVPNRAATAFVSLFSATLVLGYVIKRIVTSKNWYVLRRKELCHP